AERGDDVQREEMSAMRPEALAQPAGGNEMVDDLEIAGQPVAMDRVEDEHVTIGAEAAVARQQLRLGEREQRLAGGDRRRGGGGGEVERTENVLEQLEVGRRERARGLDSSVGPIGIHRVNGEV